MLDSDASFVADFHSPAALRLPVEAAAPALPQSAAAPRPVTPRRPLRLTAARPEEPARQPLTVPDIFAGIFDEDRPATDPRLQRGRARAMALLAAQEARLSPEERNLWHDDMTTSAPRTTAGPSPAAQDAPHRASRRVRHLTAADLSPIRADVPDSTHDPLRDRLHGVRSALYDPLPESDLPSGPTLPERLTAATFNLILLVAAFPLGLVLTALTFLRGEDLRLSAHALAIAGLVAAILSHPPYPLL